MAWSFNNIEYNFLTASILYAPTLPLVQWLMKWAGPFSSKIVAEWEKSIKVKTCWMWKFKASLTPDDFVFFASAVMSLLFPQLSWSQSPKSLSLSSSLTGSVSWRKARFTRIRWVEGWNKLCAQQGTQGDVGSSHVGSFNAGAQIWVYINIYSNPYSWFAAADRGSEFISSCNKISFNTAHWILHEK